jgi:SAM-dependent methyltransferase
MDKTILVRSIGFPATLVHGDTLVLDRWLWLKRWLPKTKNGEKLLDVGCGSGAFTIGAALRGYESTGLSWDVENQAKAVERARLCKAGATSFPIVDVRNLDAFSEYIGKFDTLVCCENMEHIINDKKLMSDMYACLKPGGRLLLTVPYYLYVAIEPMDNGPFMTVENGWHVRRGYTPAMLSELCKNAGFEIEEINYCSGYLSQKITKLWRLIPGSKLRFALTFPMRILPPLFDGLVSRLTKWPSYSICLVAYKPRWEDNKTTAKSYSEPKVNVHA